MLPPIRRSRQRKYLPTQKENPMDLEASNAKQPLPPEEAAAKAAVLAECDRLAEAGITFVVVHFDGSGDEGVTEDIKCYATEDYDYEESEVQDANFSHLQEHLEALVPYGYENDCGGFGDVILNVKTRKITVERNDRFEDYTTSTYEV
jgi:hypothetical protein